MLFCDFKDLPGESFVAQSLYRIFDDTNHARIFTRLNWSRLVRPGMRIKMAMVVSTIPFRKRACPRCGCTKYQESRSCTDESFTWYDISKLGQWHR